MTISSNLSTVTRNGNGVATSFSFPFKVWDTSQLDVYITDPDGATTTTSNFTATLSGSGGNVVYPAAGGVVLPTGWTITIIRGMPFTQNVDLVNGQAFYPDVIEQALDQLTATCQQLDEGLSRSVKVEPGQTDPAALLTQIQAAVTNSGNSATAAASSASAADLSAVSAGASATSAGAYATAAQQSADNAAANSAGLVAEVQNIAAMYIGKVFSHLATSTYVPNGCVPADGGEYTRAQFPALYDTYLAGGKLLTCTYTAWAAQVALTGNCAKFALDTANQKFKVPMLKDGDSITHAASAAELGKSYKAGLPNVKGNNAMYGDINGTAASNSALYTVPGSGGYTGTGGSKSATYLDLSRYNAIYRDDVNTVLDEQIRLRHFVVLASAQNDASVFDWSNYMAALAGKANNDLSNLEPAAGTIIRNAMKPKVLGSRSTNGAWTITGVTPGLEVRLYYAGAEAQSCAFAPTSGILYPATKFGVGVYNYGSGYASILPSSSTIVLTGESFEAGEVVYAYQ